MSRLIEKLHLIWLYLDCLIQRAVISGLSRRHGMIRGTDAAEGYVTIYAEVTLKFKSR